jgi:hypothetical protein
LWGIAFERAGLLAIVAIAHTQTSHFGRLRRRTTLLRGRAITPCCLTASPEPQQHRKRRCIRFAAGFRAASAVHAGRKARKLKPF